MSDLIQELYNKGIDVGEERGIAIGEAMGEERGIAIGEAKTLIKNVNSFLESGMPLENILSILKVSKEEYEEALQIVENLETGK